MTEMYFSADVETDGPVPGAHSMLSIGITALHPETLNECGSIYRVLERLPDATQHPDTMEWWSGFPEQYAKATEKPAPPLLAMLDVDHWVNQMVSAQGSTDTKPIFVAYPAAFDFMFYAYYAHRFVGRSVFGFSALDMSSMAMGFNGGEYDQQTKKKWPPSWVKPEDREAIHNALDDARQQADIFRRMMWSVRMPAGSRVRTPDGRVGVLGSRPDDGARYRPVFTRSESCGVYFGTFMESELVHVPDDEPLTVDTRGTR